MEKYVVLSTPGEKLVTDDLNPAFALAGSIDDNVRYDLQGPPPADVTFPSSIHGGWAVLDAAVRAGPIVEPSYANDGCVTVRPFRAYANSTSRALLTGYFAGQTIAVSTPLPAANYHRWDLLYAIISQADSDQASRQVRAVAGTVTSQLINTRHGVTVTLAWVRGIDTAVATNPYPSSSMPSLSAAPAGTSYVPPGIRARHPKCGTQHGGLHPTEHRPVRCFGQGAGTQWGGSRGDCSSRHSP